MARMQICLITFLLPLILQTLNSTALEECLRSDDFVCDITQECIRKANVCDGVYNCLYGDDEAPPACTMDECRRRGGFFCNLSWQCIRKEWECDGSADCFLGEDEAPPACTIDICNQTDRLICTESMRCIGKNRVCDGYRNCLYGDDESASACSLKQKCESKWSLSEGCFSRCKPGYFGKFCETTCSENCLNGICNIHSGICKDCTSGNFGEYCEKTCSLGCLDGICNISSGFCNDCTPGHFGKYSEKTCSKECLNGFCNCSSGICKECTPGHYGKFCDKACPEKCSKGICNIQSGICKNCTVGNYGKYCENICSLGCLNGICNISSGICNDCTPGYFGKYCEKTCSIGCLNRICNISSGLCNECTPGYFGKFCEKTCSIGCLNAICNISGGFCNDCTPGYYGKYCEKTCSEECLNGLCHRSSGRCKDCTRTYLENCSLECGQGCRKSDGFPQCDRQNGTCLHGCYVNYGRYCNETCRNCKRNSSNELCNANGVCLFGCENEYWDKKCNSKCSANCRGDEHGNRCNSSNGECINGCSRGWSGLFCVDASSLRITTIESTNKENVNSFTTTLIVISAISTLVFVFVGISFYSWARKRFNRLLNESLEQRRVFSGCVPPEPQLSGSQTRQSTSLYADINEENMEHHHNIYELNSADRYDEINVTEYNGDTGIVPSNSENRRKQAAGNCDEDEEIFADLGQFQVNYIHAIAREECELVKNEVELQNIGQAKESSILKSQTELVDEKLVCRW
ncbi:multiple epidermal growth factor-like domains protein 10 [Mya arenaria]|uniref:multiple epidermal growth factor-like domains protein 10 n=1 Tax=Mya arenaria TaxID=6604 RepID=UPI0022E38FC3|nr:multiple epidermal growth factor-like domains protein 10 [Mya arenaria]